MMEDSNKMYFLFDLLCRYVMSRLLTTILVRLRLWFTIYVWSFKYRTCPIPAYDCFAVCLLVLLLEMSRQITYTIKKLILMLD